VLQASGRPGSAARAPVPRRRGRLASANSNTNTDTNANKNNAIATKSASTTSATSLAALAGIDRNGNHRSSESRGEAPPRPRWEPLAQHAIDLSTLPLGSRALARVSVTNVSIPRPMAVVSAELLGMPHATVMHSVAPLAYGMARHITVEARGDRIGEWFGCLRVRAAGTAAAAAHRAAAGLPPDVLEFNIPMYMRVTHPAHDGCEVAPRRLASARGHPTRASHSRGSEGGAGSRSSFVWSDIPEDMSK
jgi:hypothetical protein